MDHNRYDRDPRERSEKLLNHHHDEDEKHYVLEIEEATQRSYLACSLLSFLWDDLRKISSLYLNQLFLLKTMLDKDIGIELTQSASRHRTIYETVAGIGLLGYLWENKTRAKMLSQYQIDLIKSIVESEKMKTLRNAIVCEISKIKQAP